MAKMARKERKLSTREDPDVKREMRELKKAEMPKKGKRKSY